MTARPLIRRATSADAEVIAQFNEAMALETENKVLDPSKIRSGVKAILENDHHGFYLLVEFDDTIAAGLMITYEWSDWRNGQFWWIQSVFVRPSWRRQGLYRQLYHHVQQLIEHQPMVCGIRLYMEKDNQTAGQAYRSLGMDQTDYRFFEWLREPPEA